MCVLTLKRPLHPSSLARRVSNGLSVNHAFPLPLPSSPVLCALSLYRIYARTVNLKYRQTRDTLQEARRGPLALGARPRKRRHASQLQRRSRRCQSARLARHTGTPAVDGRRLPRGRSGMPTVPVPAVALGWRRRNLRRWLAGKRRRRWRQLAAVAAASAAGNAASP